MEKYSQYRDRASGIAPFFPIAKDPSGIYLPLYVILSIIRLPILLSTSLTFFLILQWLPTGALIRKACLWIILGTPGVWWIDLQIDGVKKGQARLPQPGSIIAASHTSPLDALYLAAIFDPIFTRSFPTTRDVQQRSILQAIFDALAPPAVAPPPGAKLVDVASLLRDNPTRAIVVFPECTTTNGRGILPLAPSLLTVPRDRRIFPISLRYTAADITTPLPHAYTSFLWSLLGNTSHCIRVRIAESVSREHGDNYSGQETIPYTGHHSPADQQLLDKIADALARLGRIKRVGLGVHEKQGFIAAWTRRKSQPTQL